MFQAPELPKKTRIRRDDHIDSTTLECIVAQPRLAHFATIALFASGTVVMMIAWWVTLQRSLANPLYLYQLTISTILCIVFPVFVWVLIRMGRPETLRFTKSHFVHEFGPSPNPKDDSVKSMRSWLARALRPRRRIELSKGEMPKLLLRRTAGIEGLFYSYRGESIQIGEYLRLPDLEWLVMAIEAWKAA